MPRVSEDRVLSSPSPSLKSETDQEPDVTLFMKRLAKGSPMTNTDSTNGVGIAHTTTNAVIGSKSKPLNKTKDG